MNIDYTCCPVCTLYLREGITLQTHLATHPKEQVIDAMVRVMNVTAPQYPVMPQPQYVTAVQPPLAPTQVYPPPQRMGLPQYVTALPPPYINSSQMTTAVSFQQITTSNNDNQTFMPRFVEVPAFVAQPQNGFQFVQQGVQYMPVPNVQFAPPTFQNTYIPQSFQIQAQVINPPATSPVRESTTTLGHVSVIAQPMLSPSPEPTVEEEPAPEPQTVEEITAHVIVNRRYDHTYNGEMPKKKKDTKKQQKSVITSEKKSKVQKRSQVVTQKPNVSEEPEGELLRALGPDLQVVKVPLEPEEQEKKYSSPFSRCGSSFEYVNAFETLKDNLAFSAEVQVETEKEEEVQETLEEGVNAYGFYFENEVEVQNEEIERSRNSNIEDEVEEEVEEEVEIEKLESEIETEETVLSKVDGAGKDVFETEIYREVEKSVDYQILGLKREVDIVLRERRDLDTFARALSLNKCEILSVDSKAVDTPRLSTEDYEDTPEYQSSDLLHSFNIQADETMPAKGELSEQESLGADNTNWRSYESETTREYKSIPASSIGLQDNNEVTVTSFVSRAKQYRCNLCSMSFSCPKERRVHKNKEHIKTDDSRLKDKKVITKPRCYKCVNCELVFDSVREKKEHEDLQHSLFTSNITLQEMKAEDILCMESIKEEQSVKKLRAQSVPQLILKPCPHCPEAFPTYRKLKTHLREAHDIGRFQCTTCNQQFENDEAFNHHLKIHPLVCHRCNKQFYRRPNLMLHLKRHLAIRPFECSLCPKTFITKQKLDEHRNGHSGHKPIKCSLCNVCFSRHSNLIQHRNLHHYKIKKKIKDFVCRCGEIFHSRRKLEWHKEVHDAKPKTCAYCSQKFIHTSSLTRHIRRAHLSDYLPDTNRDDNVRCKVCNKVYIRSSLLVHMRVHTGERSYKCKVCTKGFSTKWNLILHSWTHQPRSAMPYKCSMCKSAFFRQADYCSHMNSHKNMKPFTCNVCGQQFIRKYNCIRHQNEHVKGKLFLCSVPSCGKQFQRSYYLKDHLKVHTGLRPHTCHICGKSSTTKSNHNKHVRIHDTREPINTEN